MQEFKDRWEIQHNWQLLFPILGTLMLGLSAFKISSSIIGGTNLFTTLLVSLVVFYLLLKITLYLFKLLANRWILNHKWEMIRVFIVFAVTGSSSVYVGKFVFGLLGISKESLNPLMYWLVLSALGLIVYPALLVGFGWLLGQFEFFWGFAKKMLRGLGFKRLDN